MIQIPLLTMRNLNLHLRSRRHRKARVRKIPPPKQKDAKKNPPLGKKARSRMNKLPFEELQVEFDELLEKAANKDFCKKKTGGGGSQKCKCLHLLRDPKLCESVAKCMATMDRTKKSLVDQKILDWYRYAENADGPNKYFIL